MLTPVQACILQRVKEGATRQNAGFSGIVSDKRAQTILRGLRKRGLLAIDGNGLSPSRNQLLKKDQKMREALLGNEVFFMRFALSRGPMRARVTSFNWKWVFITLRKEDVGRRNRNLAVPWKEVELTEEAAYRRVLRWARKKEKYHQNRLEALQRITEEAREKINE